jgi:hypothetical protein
MGKKKNKEPLVLDESGILGECASSLMAAFDFSIEHRDVDAMLAVSDRWLRLYAILTDYTEEKEKLKIGFLGDNNDQQP